MNNIILYQFIHILKYWVSLWFISEKERLCSQGAIRSSPSLENTEYPPPPPPGLSYLWANSHPPRRNVSQQIVPANACQYSVLRVYPNYYYSLTITARFGDILLKFLMLCLLYPAPSKPRAGNMNRQREQRVIPAWACAGSRFPFAPFAQSLRHQNPGKMDDKMTIIEISRISKALPTLANNSLHSLSSTTKVRVTDDVSRHL